MNPELKLVIRVALLSFSVFARTIAASAILTPEDCFQAHKSLYGLMDCLFTFINCHPSDNPYIPPDETERQAFQLTVNRLLQSHDCNRTFVPQIIADSYSLHLLVEKPNEESYCILYEMTSKSAKFLKGWGVFALRIPPKTEYTRPFMHISSPHSVTDGPTQLQAVAIFQNVSATSVLVATACRNQSQTFSNCENRYFSSDGAHDVTTVFHAIGQELLRWHQQNVLNYAQNNGVFLQFHGKAPTTCSSLDIFMSSGMREPAAYADPQLPIRRLQRALRQGEPQWNVKIPGDANCSLTATDNILGRLINHVPSGRECFQRANLSKFTGLFIHIEQAYSTRQPDSFDRWTYAIEAAFPISPAVTSMPLMSLIVSASTMTLLC